MMELVKIAEKLVSFNTSTGQSTMPIVGFIEDFCTSLGFQVETYPYTSDNLSKANLIARWGGPFSKIALAGHVDTVPCNLNIWNEQKLDPWTLKLRKEKYYGRGISDMKLFLAYMLKIGERLAEQKIPWPIALCFTSDEEVGCLGAKKLKAKNAKLANYVIVGEPTKMQPIIRHKGYTYAVIKLKSKGGHASEPEAGRNVIELALPGVIGIILELKKRLQEVRDSRFQTVPYPTVNIGVVDTGANAVKNKIAEYCRLELEIRPIPGQDPMQLYRLLEKTVTTFVDQIDGVTAEIQLPRNPALPLDTRQDSVIAQVAKKATHGDFESANYNTEAGIYNILGSEAIVLGPGSISQAHKDPEFVDEHWLNEANLEPFLAILQEVVEATR